ARFRTLHPAPSDPGLPGHAPRAGGPAIEKGILPWRIAHSSSATPAPPFERHNMRCQRHPAKSPTSARSLCIQISSYYLQPLSYSYAENFRHLTDWLTFAPLLILERNPVSDSRNSATKVAMCAQWRAGA